MVFRLETLSAINEYPKISDPEIIKAIIGPIKMKVKTEQQAINRK